MDQQTPNPELQASALSPAPARRGLPWAVQLTLLLFVGALLFTGVFGRDAVRRLAGLAVPEETPAAAQSATNTGQAFKVTDRQWATLKVVPVGEAVFQDAIETDGRIALDDDLVTPVFSPFSGHITRLIAHAGDLVAKGDPLFAIQASELAQAQNDLIAGGAALRTAKAQLALATTNEQRQHTLYQAQGAALKDWQQAQLDLATAQGAVSTTSIALATVRNRLRILGKTEAEIAQIEATSDIPRLDAETIVRAPIGGTVVQRQVSLGQNIVSASSGASNPVFLIGDLSRLWLVANVREEDAPKTRKGNPVTVAVLAFPGKPFQARLLYVSGAIDPVTHRLPVRAEVDNPDGLLKPDMLARFRIILGPDVRAPAVPDVAVVHEADSAHVWVADPAAKTLEIRQIILGRAHDGLIEVTQGLKTGEQIVTAGAVFIDRAATGD